jgi:hypothetical protein
MNFKKIHVLLIAMSVFLLISIGSACAADNTAVDADNQLSAPDSDVTLSDGDEGQAGGETTEKTDTEVIADDITVNEGDNITTPVTVKNKNDSSDIGITTENLTVLNGDKTVQFSYNESQLSINQQFAPGKYNLTIKYLGNANYSASNTTLLLNVIGPVIIQAPNSVNVNSSDIVEIPLNVTNSVEIFDITKDDFTVTVTYKDGNETKTVNITTFEVNNGILSFIFNNRTISSGTIALTYNNTASKNITFKRIANARIEVINNVVEYKNGDVIIRIVDIDDETNILSNRKVSLYFSGNVRAGFSGTTNATGYAVWAAKNLYTFEYDGKTIDAKTLDVKTYSVSVEDTDDFYVASKVETNITVIKAEVIVDILDFKETYGTTKQVQIVATFKNGGAPVPNEIVKINVPKSTQKVLYAYTDANGTAKLTVSGLTGGEYDISATMNDTSKMKSNTDSNKIIIVKKEVKLSTNDVSIYYNTGTTATIKVLDKSTGKGIPNAIVKVTIYSGSKKVFEGWVQTSDKGVATLTTPLAVGKYKITLSMDSYEPRYKASSLSKSITVLKHNARFYAPYTTAYYKEGKYFTVKLLSNKNKKVIFNGKLKVRIMLGNGRYYQYTGYTSIDGTLKIKIDLNPGTYAVYINGLDGKNYTVSQLKTTIKVLPTPTKLAPTALTAKYKSNSVFKVKAINTKTNKVIAGLKVGLQIYTGKTYKVVYAVTNAQGIAQFSVKALSVGTHKVVAYSTNKYCKASVATSSIKIVK